ncbi:MAG: nucleotidyltransferase family protein [Deltaproteobacteria bacterium]|nr:nucleotidyltransferase family protein [Deltaproteobacteria bacterium]
MDEPIKSSQGAGLGVNQLLEMLRPCKDLARQKYKADIKGIFGSYARSEENGQSDIDVLVEFEEEANLIDLISLSMFLQEKLGRAVDVVPQSTIREELRPTIMKEMIYL